jgi:hypothetical protein
MPVVREITAAERMIAVEQLPATQRILDCSWTTAQPHALVAMDRRVQQHVEHGAAHYTLELSEAVPSSLTREQTA